MAETLRKLSPVPPPRRAVWLRLVPAATLALFLGPIGAGLAFTLLPAFGWLPALGGATATLDPWRALFAAPELPGALRLTLSSGLASTVISVTLVILFTATCHDRPVFAALRRLLAPLLAIPHAAMALGLAFLIAPSGWLVRLVSRPAGWDTPPDIATLPDPYGLALVLGLVLKETPYLLLMTLAALDQVPAARSLTVARSLGYGPAAAWLKVVLPQVYPQIRLPIFAVLAYALSTVDMAIVLAPNTPPPLAPLLVRWFNDPDLARRFVAAAGAAVQLGLVAAAILLWLAAERLVAGRLRPRLADGRRGAAGGLAATLAGGAMAGVAALAGLSLAGMVLWSVATRWRYPDVLPAGLTLDAWTRHADAVAWPLSVTVIVGLVAAALALALVVGCLENEQHHGLHPTARVLWVLYLPLLVPQISFLFGLQVLLAAIGLDGTWPGLVWSHLLFVLPYAWVVLAEARAQLAPGYRIVARTLGAGPFTTWSRILLPQLLRSILVAAGLCFAVSMALYLPTQFAGSGRIVTVTTEAAVALSSGDLRSAASHGVMQALLPLALFALTAWTSRSVFTQRRGMPA